VYTVAEAPTVRAFHGMTVVADYAFQNAPKPDMICVPGGFGTEAGTKHDPLLGYIAHAGAEAQIVSSVCTGAFLLHATGFLEGKRATTHWNSMKNFRALGQNLQVVDDERWVHDGNVVTAAGISAGIDMALYLVGQLKSPDVARNVQRFMEYHPAPPYG